jgi:hypothetical protein
MLAAGRHSIARQPHAAQAKNRRDGGKTTAIQLDVPSSADRAGGEITVDGNSVGETPIANLLVSVGSHEMVFRHPQLGERRQTVVVTAKGPNRIAVDFTK